MYWEFDIGVFLYTTYWMYYVYMYNICIILTFFSDTVFLVKRFLDILTNLHSVNICRKKVFLSLKELEFDGNTDSAKIEEIFLDES